MAYIDQYTLAQDATFQHKVQIAVIEYARIVIAESSNEASQLWAKRTELARSVLADGCINELSRFVYAVVSVNTINSQDDLSISGTVQAVYNGVAGVTDPDSKNR